MNDAPGMVLRTLHGHPKMEYPHLHVVEGGVWCWVECRLERPDLAPEQQDTYNPVHGHWLAPSVGYPSLVVLQTEPYVWPTSTHAVQAYDQWVHQNQ